MSLPILPTGIPFNLGAQEETISILPYGLTSLLPVNNLPFTLSALPAPVEVPYGSIGWEIVCRSYSDFQTILFATKDMAPPAFSKELSATGMASVSFDLDHYLFGKTLQNGQPVEYLFNRENLWEIYFDKKLRFQFLGTASKVTELSSDEVRTASVSGSGIAQVLTWATVYPKNFPNVVKKLELLRDDFNSDRINTTIWNKTTTVDGGIETSREGQKEAALAEIELLTQQRLDKIEERNAKQLDMNQAQSEYNTVYKNKNSTAAQKKAASKALATAKAARDKAISELAVIDSNLANANLKSSLAPNIIEDDTAARAKLTITSAGQVKTLAAGMYEFASSGISARVEPLPQGVSQGQAKTLFGVQFSNVSWAHFYTANIGGNRRLVAEVADNSTVYADDFSYNPNLNAWWRVREDHSAVIFETSANGTIWVEHFRVEEVSWASGLVFAQFKVSLEGNAGVKPPISAYISNVNTQTLPAVESVMANFLEHLEASKGRGTIPYVAANFTEFSDTAGATWVGKPVVDVNEGINLLQLLTQFAQIQQFDWIMDNNFQLKVFQRVWNTDETDPTVRFHKEDTIVFHEGNSQLVRENSQDRSQIGNSIVGKTNTGEYAYVEDEESMENFQRRELFIDAGNSSDLVTLGTMLNASLAEVKDQKSSWRLVVDPNLPGKRIFDDYDVGDWISVEVLDSLGRAKKNVWRIVGIALQVDSDGNTTAELTLQSRLQLFVERLKQQVASVSSSASGAGVTLGKSVSAATLIEQAKLSNLMDVALPPEQDRLPGDVLTWTGNYFTLQTPGDKTIPASPEILGVASNVYYPETGITTKAQVKLTWTTPLNTDGSTITDGHHYEVRYRPDTSLPYSATWEEVGQRLWTELYSWAQPTIPPIENTGWDIIFVGFDENELILQEFTPGVVYEFQVRAVDSSTPQHWSEWSESVIHEAANDTIPPAQPAAPLVASSRLAIQVTHYLGKAEGGEFNLPPDLSHLEVHVGGPAFFPTESTYVGKIVADVSILRGRTPVIQTFQVETTENIWVRIIAVDRTGNRSSPSMAATTQVDLIDSAHISDLTASKITAGTISSAIILSGVIKTAENGPRAEMNFEGFRIFGEEESAAVSLLSTPGPNGNYLLIKDPEDNTSTLAGIDGTGRGSFQSVSVANDLTVDGEDLLGDIINPRGKGVIAMGTYVDPVVGAGTNIERGFLEISFVAEASRTYNIFAVSQFESTAASERLIMRLRDGGENAPTLALPYLQESIHPQIGNAGVNSTAQITYTGTFTPGLHRILWTFLGQLGNATINPTTNSLAIFLVEDLGVPKTDTVVLNDAGIPAAGSSLPGGGTTPKTEYTKTYACTWSGTFRSNGDYSSSHGATIVQGDSGADNWLNDARGLMGFNYAQIMSDTSGATIKACYVTLYANHWYWNDGGTARIGTHNYTARPGSISSSRYSAQRVSSSSWPKPGKRKVSLGTTIGNEFKSGAAKGIILGPTDGSKRQYGRFNGNGQSSEPVLTIVYVK